MGKHRKPSVEVDREHCAGHGRCYDLAPEIFESDDEGFAMVVGTADDAATRDKLAAAKLNCPERAIVVSDEP